MELKHKITRLPTVTSILLAILVLRNNSKNLIESSTIPITPSCSKMRHEVLNLSGGENYHETNINNTNSVDNVQPPPPPPPIPPPPPVVKEERNTESTPTVPFKPPPSISTILRRNILRDKIRHEKELIDSRNDQTDKILSSSVSPTKTENMTMFSLQKITTIPFYKHYHILFNEFKMKELILFPTNRDDDEYSIKEKEETLVKSTNDDNEEVNMEYTTQEKPETDIIPSNNDNLNNPSHTIVEKNSNQHFICLLLLQSLYKKQQQEQKQQFTRFEDRILKILSKFQTNHEEQQQHYQATLLNKLQLLLYDNSDILLERIQKQESKLLLSQQTKFLKKIRKMHEECHVSLLQKMNDIILQEKEFDLFTQKKNQQRKRYISLLDSLDRDATSGSSTTRSDPEEQPEEEVENTRVEKGGNNYDEVFENVLRDLMLPSSEDNDGGDSDSD